MFSCHLMFSYDLFRVKHEANYEFNGFYTFIYNAKTPNIEYDQHPLIVCLEILPWGFRGFNFHWRKYRNYTWMEVVGQMHIVRANELDELLAIPYAKFRLNK